jgi:alkanesulfonate monooxygenase SsuD/methylene tetrahydromethanopterin reductase-like flavin-dependent oxidoreductase (luciferase family)
LTALTALSRRLVGIPLVLAADYRHPVTLAKMGAALDVISGGHRLIMGLGYGGIESDQRGYGFGWDPIATRIDRVGEQVQVMRQLWTRPQTSFEGIYSSLQDVPGFPVATPGGPPVLIASRGRRYGLAGVARDADLCNISFDISPAEWAEYLQVLAAHCAPIGRDPGSIGLTHNASVVIDHNRRAAIRRRDVLLRSLDTASQQARRGLVHALVGTPDEIVEQLVAYREAGLVFAWVFLLFSDLPSIRSMRMFAEEVLPRYRAAERATFRKTGTPRRVALA